MDERDRRFGALIGQVRIVTREPVRNHHPLVDDGAGRAARDVEGAAFGEALGAKALMALLADDEELALERIDVRAIGAGRDEELPDHRLDRLDALAQRGAVARHVAPAQQRLALGGNEFRDGLLAGAAGRWIARQENHADAVAAGLRQGDPQRRGLFAQQPVRKLDQDAGAVAGERIGADRAAMVEVLENLEPVEKDAMALVIPDMGDKADTARIVLLPRIVQSLPFGHGLPFTPFRVAPRANRADMGMSPPG